jgi:hypothetical protein
MGKRHQASRRKAYGRRQHELRERFEHTRTGTEPIRVEVYDTEAYDDAQDPFAPYDLVLAGRVGYSFHD